MDIWKRINTVIAASLAILAVAACKKDDDEVESLPSLGGQLRFEVTPYIVKKDTLTMKPTGVTHPEGKGIGYYWTVSDVTETNDTTKTETDDPAKFDGTFGFRFPDEIGTYTVSCTAFASGYYNTSAVRYVTVVDKEESLIDINLGYEGVFGAYQDPRDGRNYKTVEIDGLEWFAENLKYSGLPEDDGEGSAEDDESGTAVQEKTGIAYDNAEAMSDIFGRYYTWKEAKSACPETDGWRLPDAGDWLDLANAIDRMTGGTAGTGNDSADTEYSGGERFTDTDTGYEGITGAMMVEAKFNSADNEMWDYWPDVKITNMSGLSMIPCGFANLSKTSEGKPVGTFETMNLYAAFWTAEENPEDAGQAMFRYIYWDTPVLQLGHASKTDFAATVRCVRNSE